MLAPDSAIDIQTGAHCLESRIKVDWVGAISLSGEGAPVIATATAREVRLASGASLSISRGRPDAPPTEDGILPVDFNYDFKTDLVLAGAGGVRLFRQEVHLRLPT